MRITPMEIQQHQFKSRLLGYDSSAVDHFLELLAEEMERLHTQNHELKETLARTRTSLEQMKQREQNLQDTLTTAQQVTDELKQNARKESEILLVEAKMQGEQILRAAEERRIQLINEVQEIKRQKISFESSLRAVVESHMKLLDLEVVAIEGGGDDGEDCWQHQLELHGAEKDDRSL
ncbi:MAG: cell division protein DivIVA [Desulfuromonas sp.]|nr:MAG: cell division protein DivIVA [Desulfuromonas sp.]